MKHEQSKHFGMNAENYFSSKLNQCGIQHEFIDTWYDFLINKKEKVEVKSCRISVKDGKRDENRYRPGRFDFTSKEARENQYKENIWVCFILRNNSDFMLLGFTRARNLKKKRYVPLTDLRKISILDLNNWLLRVNK